MWVLPDLSIDKELDTATRQIVSYRFHSYFSEDVVWMDGRPRPPEFALHKQAGFSTGRWEGNTLVITTTHLKEGDPYQGRRAPQLQGDGDQADQSLRQLPDHRVSSSNTRCFWRNRSSARRRGSTLQTRWFHRSLASPLTRERSCRQGGCRILCPGQNDAINEFATEFGIPPEASQGGAETTYPEYVEKMKTMKKLPRTTTTHYQRAG